MLARYLSLAVILLLVTATVAVGSSFEAGAWYYDKVSTPSWAPPEWLLGPVWAVVYLLMALAAWQLWLTGHYDRIKALAWWALVLLLLLAWNVLFFGMHRPGWAWMGMTVALGVTVLCIRAFRPLSQPAAYLMLPALAWIAFYWCLNFVTWNMSGGPLASYFR